jgi:F0F1-type ATP synthase membrane subunit b/b'
MEKIKKYLNEIEYNNDINVNHINNKRKDEDAFDKMTNIIESIRREEEIIYCDLKPAKNKLAIIQGLSQGNNASAERISNLIDKIEKLQNDIRSDPNKLIKREVEEIHGMIKSMPDENEKKLFRDNLLDSSRLYDVFLPLTTLLMIMTFLSIGIKRTKNYEKKLDDINEENEQLELENEEIKGKLKTLNEINSKIKDINEDDNNLIDYNNAKNSLDELTQLVLRQKEDINKQQNQLFDDIEGSLVKPSSN